MQTNIYSTGLEAYIAVVIAILSPGRSQGPSEVIGSRDNNSTSFMSSVNNLKMSASAIEPEISVDATTSEFLKLILEV